MGRTDTLKMRPFILLLLALYLLLYIVPLGARPLAAPDEVRYAEIPREMLVSGDWVVPHLDGLRYFEKPVLGYWVVAGSMVLFGENRFAVRFPSALAVAISAVLLFTLMRKFSGRPYLGWLAAIIFLTCFEVFALGVFNVLDGTFSLFLTGGLIFFFYGYQDTRHRKRYRFFVVSGILMGLAFLTKGFLAIAIPLLVIAPFLIWERKGFAWGGPLIVLSVSALLTALPWCIAIYRREPDFWRYFFWVQHIQRFSSSEPQHPRPDWFFVPILLIGALPWTALIPAAVAGLRRQLSLDSLTRFALCWFIFPFLLFSVSRGKLLTYIYPCFPPLALLVSQGLDRYLQEGKRRTLAGGVLLLIVVTAMVLLLLCLNRWIGSSLLPFYEKAETWKRGLLILSLSVAILLLILANRTSHTERKLLFFALAPSLFFGCTHLVIPNQILQKVSPGRVLLVNRHPKK
jgi:4-amino-4-deoxy-L-arabinose transferase